MASLSTIIKQIKINLQSLKNLTISVSDVIDGAIVTTIPTCKIVVFDEQITIRPPQLDHEAKVFLILYNPGGIDGVISLREAIIDAFVSDYTLAGTCDYFSLESIAELYSLDNVGCNTLKYNLLYSTQYPKP